MTLASATDLAQWAGRRDAQGGLPQLVRRLVAATNRTLTRVSFRSGEGVALPGWDGLVHAEFASAFVPAGLSAWEMGVGAPAPKANVDYDKRTANPDGLDHASTTFVFVTPQRWKGKDGWVQDRNAEGRWRAVVALDADDLASWLETAPGVHAWFSALIGLDPYEVESIETWWSAWSEATRPPLPATALMAGRDRHARDLLGALAAEPNVTSVVADSQDEALAFTAAALLGQSAFAERAVVVRTPQAWRRVAVSEHPLLLIPTFERPAFAPALRAGHHVVLPLGRETASSDGLMLPRLDRAGIEVALAEAGLARERAASLATLGRQSLLALRRALAVNPDVDVPDWSRPENAREIAPLVLVGAWRDSSDGDRDAVAALTGRPYGEVSQTLSRWAAASNPPVRRTGDVWMVAAKSDAWVLTAPSLTSDDLDRLRQTATDVLGVEDPTLELTPDQRPAAALLGIERRYSGVLVKGLADTLALLATTSAAVPLPGGWSSASLAGAVVRDVLGAANEDPSGRRWHAVAGALPLLAEAAPGPFLQAVEDGTQSAEGPVLQLFQDDGAAPALMGGSPHPSLLWALETLAWSPEHLARSARISARLVRLEPGGTTLNRPFNSLRDTLLLWRPGTAATLDQRLQVVDLLRKHEPAVAWPLMLALVPTGNGFASATAAPTHRDWKPEDTGHVPADDLDRAVAALLDRAAADAGADGGRWAALVDRAVSCVLPVLDPVLQNVESLDPRTLDADGLLALYRTLLNLVHRHRQFPDADWSMAKTDTDRLAALAKRFTPDIPQDRYGWLFDQGGLDGFRLRGEDYAAQQRALNEAQDAALSEILHDLDVEALVEWTQSFSKPDVTTLQLGEALARVDPDNLEALALVTADDEDARRLGVQYVHGVARVKGTEWLIWAKEILAGLASGWSASERALFLQTLPTSEAVWDLAAESGGDTDRAYWEAVSVHNLPWDDTLAIRAAERLLDVGRPRAAVNLYRRVAYRNADAVPLANLAHALEESIRTAQTPFDADTARAIGDHLDRLAEADFDADRLARLEWAFLPLFRFERRQSPVLHQALADDPALFADVVALVYRADGEEPRELSDVEQAQAKTAHDLLDSWRTVPGTRSDGTLDPDALLAWVEEARGLLAARGRATTGDLAIGRVLRYGPPPRPASDAEPETDEASPLVDWPAEPIRDVVEAIASEHLERGFAFEVYNSVGVTTRGPTDGGDQERARADLHRQQAAFAGLAWPRTAAMLTRVAESFERDAERHDQDADLTQDTWR